MDMPPTKSNKSGEVRIIDAKNFKITTTSAAIVTVKPGGVGELHWHPNADEWQYHFGGKGRMTVFTTGAAPAPWISKPATSATFKKLYRTTWKMPGPLT
jgi:oxalate decarboxylase